MQEIYVFFPFSALATWSFDTALQSAIRIRKYNPTLLAAGHGDLLYSPCQAIDNAIKQAEINLNRKEKHHAKSGNK